MSPSSTRCSSILRIVSGLTIETCVFSPNKYMIKCDVFFWGISFHLSCLTTLTVTVSCRNTNMALHAGRPNQKWKWQGGALPLHLQRHYSFQTAYWGWSKQRWDASYSCVDISLTFSTTITPWTTLVLFFLALAILNFIVGTSNTFLLQASSH